MIEQITPGQFAQWAQSHAAGDARPLLIDVREPWEWQIASVTEAPGYELRKLSMNHVPAELDLLDPDRPTALLCHHGRRSQSVALYLQENGFAKLANITGGIDAWADQAPDIPKY